MDQDVINLAKAIRQHESGGNYNASGTSTESGAFQYMPATWKSSAKKYLGSDSAPMTPENQKAVAYLTIKADKDAGLNPAEIAAKWNSGTTTWQGKVGTNKFGVKYDVPAYVKAVTDLYKQYKQSSAPGQSAPATPTKFSVAAPVDHAKLAAQANADAATAAAESKKANSFMGIFKKTISGAGQAIASSEVNLGNTIGSIIGTNKFSDQAVENIKKVSDTQVQLARTIREKEAKGLDTTKEKKIYNDNVGLLDELNGNLKDLTAGSQKSNTQVAGELGGTALDLLTAGTYGKEATAGMESGKLAKSSVPFIKKAATVVSPELGKVAEVASKPTGLFTAKGAANVAKGAGVGYGYDVSQNAQSGKTGSDIFVPGAGTVIGGAIPFVSELQQSFKNRNLPTKIIADREKEIFNIENNYAKTRKAMDFSKDAGLESRKRIASTDVLVGSVDENGTIRTTQPGGAIDKYKAMTIDGAEGVVRKDLEREGSKVSPEIIKQRMIDNINRSSLKGEAKMSALNSVDSEIKGLMLDANPDGTIPLTTVHDAKINQTNGINFQTEPHVKTKAKAFASAYKTVIEDTSNTPVKKVNAELAKYLQDIELLKNLDGKKVKGGRLGKYFATITGNMVGGALGGAIGGFPGMTIGTNAGGETASALKGAAMSRTLGKETGNLAPRSAIIDEAVARGKSPRLMLPAGKPVENPALFVTPGGKASSVAQEAADVAVVETGKTNLTKKLGRPKNPLINGDHFYETPATIQAGKTPKAAGTQIDKLGPPKVFSKIDNIQSGTPSAGKKMDISKEIEASLKKGSDLGKIVKSLADKAKKAGYEFLTFTHPGKNGEGYEVYVDLSATKKNPLIVKKKIK